jgi:hypothetical protein
MAAEKRRAGSVFAKLALGSVGSGQHRLLEGGSDSAAAAVVKEEGFTGHGLPSCRHKAR